MLEIPVLSAFIPFWDGEGENFHSFITTALSGESAPFVATIANQIPDYDEIVKRRHELDRLAEQEDEDEGGDENLQQE